MASPFDVSATEIVDLDRNPGTTTAEGQPRLSAQRSPVASLRRRYAAVGLASLVAGTGLGAYANRPVAPVVTAATLNTLTASQQKEALTLTAALEALEQQRGDALLAASSAQRASMDSAFQADMDLATAWTARIDGTVSEVQELRLDSVFAVSEGARRVHDQEAQRLAMQESALMITQLMDARAERRDPAVVVAGITEFAARSSFYPPEVLALALTPGNEALFSALRDAAQREPQAETGSASALSNAVLGLGPESVGRAVGIVLQSSQASALGLGAEISIMTVGNGAATDQRVENEFQRALKRTGSSNHAEVEQAYEKWRAEVAAAPSFSERDPFALGLLAD